MDSISDADYAMGRPHLDKLLVDLQRSCCRAYWDGLEAAARGINKEQNPFPEHSAGADFWLAGYSQSN